MRVLVASSALVATAIGYSIGAAATPGPGFSPAEPGEPTYEVSDVQVEYPYEPRAGEEESTQAVAGVSFALAWSDGYPGPAVCRFELLNGSGEEVGYRDVEIDSLTPSLNAPAPIAVPVSSSPVTGRAECSAGTPGVGVYTLSLEGDPTEAGPSIATAIVRATWGDEGDPGTNSCVGTADTTLGEISTDPFTVDVGDGDVFPVEIPTPVDTILAVDFKCVPFAQSTQATEGVDGR
jgi:hypothetical protein